MQDVPILTFPQYVLYVWTWGALLQRGRQSLKMSYVHGESSARDSVFTEGRGEAAPATHHGTFSTERQVPGVHAPDTPSLMPFLPDTLTRVNTHIFRSFFQPTLVARWNREDYCRRDM